MIRWLGYLINSKFHINNAMQIFFSMLNITESLLQIVNCLLLIVQERKEEEGGNISFWWFRPFE